MSTIGIVGSGNIGSTVARLAIEAGHGVVVSNSRGPHTLRSLVAELGPQARAATTTEAAREGELVLVSVPLVAYPSLSGLPLRGKVVMDTGNYYPQRDGQIPALDDKALTDSEYLRSFLPGAEVVKVFNNIFFKHLRALARPVGDPERSALPIAGDSAAAKSAVADFLSSLGYDVVDGGQLEEGWRQQPGTPVYASPYGSFDDEQGTPAGVEVVRSALGVAERS